MRAATHLLLSHASELFDVPAQVLPSTGPSSPSGLSSPRHVLLDTFYEEFNGGYFWNRALLVRPMQGTDGAPLAVVEWNERSLWKALYEGVCEGTTFFAEDAFGMQFGIREGRVVQFDPETAAITDCAETLQEWVMLLIRESAYYTGAPVLAAWAAKNSTIKAGNRLLPKQLFMLGGEFHSENMICKSDVEGLRVRAQMWRMTRDLPDGQEVSFNVVE